MILFEEAIKIVLNSVRALSCEKVMLLDSLHRTLGEDVVSDMDMPPFNKSAVDGYACKHTDIHNNLEVLEIIAAGAAPKYSISKNQCSKIMTGAVIPEGADCVLMVEHTEQLLDNKICFAKGKSEINISYKAEDIKKGEVILKKGIIIKPQHIALLASVGYTEPLVLKKPSVAVISTGSELVEPKIIPSPVQIRNSNAWQLFAQIKRANAFAVYIGIVGDSEEETNLAIKNAISKNDVVILTGGVSMGDFDFVPKILKQNNVNLLFEKIAIKPGKPTVFGVHDKGYVFGLPGNPVASFVLFEVMIKPFLNKLMGVEEKQLNLLLPLGVNYVRKKTDRLAWISAKINEAGEVIPVECHGSAHLFSICDADVIFPVNIGISEFKKGELVNVRQI